MRCSFLIIFALLTNFASQAAAQEKQTLGWLEKVRIFPGELQVLAKLDTGADYSSLNVPDFEEFEKNGRKFVRFSLQGRMGQKATIEKEVIRQAWVKTHSGKHQKRDVVTLGICLGKTYLEAEVNITDRSNFKYQLLIGRNYMAGNVIVDSASSYTREPTCKGAPGT